MVYITSLCGAGLQANIKHNQCRAFSPRPQDTPQHLFQSVSTNLSRTEVAITK